MNEVINKAGYKVCADCGIPTHRHDDACNQTDVVTERVRRVIAQCMASRRGADTAAVLSLAVIADFLAESGLSVVDGQSNISDVIA
jgi:hypothetical protein